MVVTGGRRLVVGAPAAIVTRFGFAAATRALRTAQAFGRNGVQRFGDLGLLPAVVADQAVGRGLVARYLDPVSADVAASVRAWLDAGMHVDRAAEALFVHANTLRYRLSRFEEATGCSLRDTTTQFEVWWALQVWSVLQTGSSNGP